MDGESDISVISREKVYSDVGAVDIQGISWESLAVSRDDFRQLRVDNYINYTSILQESIDISSSNLQPCHEYYKFLQTNLLAKCSIAHFQLRSLMAITSKNDVYFTSSSSVNHFNPTTNQIRSVFEPIEHGMDGVTALAADYQSGLLIAGGFNGDLLVKSLHSAAKTPDHVSVTTRTNGIINHLQVVTNRQQEHVVLVSSNDCALRILNLESLKMVCDFEYEFPINGSCVSSDKRMICLVGDSKESLIASMDSGQVLFKLSGHSDYSFACAWSPNGFYVATGNQDKTSRIYDVRNPQKCLREIKSNMAGVRGLEFSSDGQFLAIAEGTDFVHLLDMKNEEIFTTDGIACQTIDFFGEVSGMGFSPTPDFLFIATTDAMHGGILEFELNSENTEFCHFQ